jgi:hypothetical protein
VASFQYSSGKPPNNGWNQKQDKFASAPGGGIHLLAKEDASRQEQNGASDHSHKAPPVFLSLLLDHKTTLKAT